MNDIVNFIKQEEDVEDEGEDLREFISKNREKITNANKIISKASTISKFPQPKQKIESSTPDKMDKILNALEIIKLNQDNYTTRLGKIKVHLFR